MISQEIFFCIYYSADIYRQAHGILNRLYVIVHPADGLILDCVFICSKSCIGEMLPQTEWQYQRIRHIPSYYFSFWNPCCGGDVNEGEACDCLALSVLVSNVWVQSMGKTLQNCHAVTSIARFSHDNRPVQTPNYGRPIQLLLLFARF